MNYYNEWNAYRADWLRNLIRDGLIPDGEVDERGIEEIKAEDLEGFTQVHFFAGIGGWPEAFRLAGWFPDVPVWSGSCPCQPLSCAGKRKGETDSRHLWPVFYRLICKRRPPVVFGEQTASGDGPEWVAGVRLDLEAAGYRVGIANLPAACCGAPHPRSRLWWVAHACEGGRTPRGHKAIRSRRKTSGLRGTHVGGLADAGRAELAGRPVQSARKECQALAGGGGAPGGLAHADGIGAGDSAEVLQARQSESRGEGFWSDYQVLHRNEPKRGLVPCRAEPGIFPLAARFPTRLERLRAKNQISAYGDAIVPQCAAEFVRTFMDCR